MSNAPAPKPERTYCANCGYPLRGGRCEACGTVPEAASARDLADDIPTKQNQLRPYAADLDVDLIGLERVIDAHRAKDLHRFVEQTVAVEGAGTAHAAAYAEGVAWIATIRGGVVCALLRAANDELILEAPICRLPAHRRLPALRLALELCGADAASSRACLRGDLLLLRWTARASQVTPGMLRHYLREIGHLSARYAGLFVIGMDAPPAFNDEQRSSGRFEVLGRGKKIAVSGGGARRSIPPAAAPAPAPAPMPRAAARPVDIARAPELEPTPEAIPAVLSPMFSSSPPGGSPAVPPPPPVPQMPAARPSARVIAPPTAPTGTAIRAEFDSLSGATAPAQDPARRAEASSGAGVAAADRLCMLLRHAQALGSQTLEERPATLTWLVRSAVFRAIYDFKDTVPDAVAHLYRCIGIGNGAGRRTSSSALPGNEPALLVMERVIVARGQMPKEKPMALEPMVSAAQAKEHVARYLSEIDKSPQDPGVRHFLALGALTELLVRTKLPPQTDQRLRDIVAHAQREGAKAGAIELMMTALQRINA